MLRHPADARHLSEQQLGWLALSLRGDPRYSVSDILADVDREAAQLWSVEDAEGAARVLLVTRLIWYPSCCALQVHLCGGSGMAQWVHLLSDLEDHARKLGCRFIELTGRTGWQRVLPEYEWRGVSLSKELT